MRGATVLYATHIFDGLEFWPTHIAYMAQGEMRMLKKAEEVPELASGRLLELACRLLGEEEARVFQARGPRTAEWDPSREGQVLLPEGLDLPYSPVNGRPSLELRRLRAFPMPSITAGFLAQFLPASAPTL